MRPARKCDCGLLFEGFHELDQVAFIRRSARKDVHVVGHNAIRMDEKRAGRGVSSQAGDDPPRDAGVRAKPAAVVEAERQEIKASAAITVDGEPDVSALELGGGHGYLSPERAALKAAALRLNLSHFDLECFRRIVPEDVDHLDDNRIFSRP